MRKNGSDSTKLLKKSDLYLVIILLIVAGIAFAWMKISSRQGKTVAVTVDGAVYGTYPLDQDRELTIQINEASWINVLKVENGYADMIDADCPDKICVDHKPISKVGETIVCLPHKVVVEITEGGAEGDSEFDVIAK